MVIYNLDIHTVNAMYNYWLVVSSAAAKRMLGGVGMWFVLLLLCCYHLLESFGGERFGSLDG